MRIVHEDTIRGIRCSLFEFQGKYTIKLEVDKMEQIFKFRDGAFEDHLVLIAYIQSDLFKEHVRLFQEMSAQRNELVKFAESSSDSTLDEII